MSTLLFYNFKGGVGKSSLSVILTYHLVRAGKKVLFVDLDPQANGTELLGATYSPTGVVPEPERSEFDGLLKGNLQKSIVHLDKNIDVIPSEWDMSLWNQKVERVDQHQRNLILKTLLEPIKFNYDYVILDVPPTLSTLVTNACLASDYITIVLQTQRSAYTSALKTAKYLADLRRDYDTNFKLTGVILYLMKKGGHVDTGIAREARVNFGEALYANQIYGRERVKYWSDNGITDKPKDHHDQATHEMYSMIFKEFLLRVKELGDDTNG